MVTAVVVLTAVVMAGIVDVDVDVDVDVVSTGADVDDRPVGDVSTGTADVDGDIGAGAVAATSVVPV